MTGTHFNSLAPAEAIWKHVIQYSLVQVMACHMCNAKPTFELMLTFPQWQPTENISMTFCKQFKCFHLQKYTSKYILQNVRHFVQALKYWTCHLIQDAGRYSIHNISRLVCQKQVSRAGTSNYIPQNLCDVITCPALDVTMLDVMLLA